MINPALSVPHGVLSEFCKRNGIRELAVFGSATRDDFRPDSDVDLLVEFRNDAKVGLIAYSRMQRKLSDLFRRRVDLIEKDGLKQLIRDSILSQAETLYTE